MFNQFKMLKVLSLTYDIKRWIRFILLSCLGFSIMGSDIFIIVTHNKYNIPIGMFLRPIFFVIFKYNFIILYM